MVRRGKERTSIKLDALIPLLEEGLPFAELMEKLGAKSESNLKLKILEACVLQKKTYNPEGLFRKSLDTVKYGSLGIRIPKEKIPEDFIQGDRFKLDFSKGKIILSPDK